MAHSQFEYTRNYEINDSLPLDNWIVVRIDGRGFSKLTKKYDFDKPNDSRALDLMNAAATEVVRSLSDIVVAYGQSDEYSFVLHDSTTLFDRRSSKLISTIASTFSVEYALQWAHYFPEKPLTRPFPTFDGRAVCYPHHPTRNPLRDYLSWRQADCHINNLYNTTFWNMVLKGGMSTTEAEEALKGTVSSDKNEILFSRFGINYNNEPQIYRKGTVIYRGYDENDEAVNGAGKRADPSSKTQLEKDRKKKQKAKIVCESVDIIGDEFWNAHPYILAAR